MDPALGSIIGLALAAAIAGSFAVWQTIKVERVKERTSENTAAMEAVKVQIDGWDRLTESYREELARKDERITALVADRDSLERQLRVARIEIEYCRTHHPPLEGHDDV